MLLILHIVVGAALMVRVLLKPHRDPATRIAWSVVILGLPLLGALAYLLLGEANIGRRRVERMRRIGAVLPAWTGTPGIDETTWAAAVPERCVPLATLARSISGFTPVGGNQAELMADSDAAMVADIDAATEHVHLLFYIWLPDRNGLLVAKALERAAARGVTCRAMVDDLGSRIMVKSRHWREMGSAGVRLARALPIGNPLLRVLDGRIDLRNHRKIVVIDDRITYCGSQNCTAPEFRIKARYAPWVDVMVRFSGPIARQNQHLFLADWLAQVDEPLGALVQRPLPACGFGITAQAFGTGPTVRYSAMPEMFAELMYAARRELVVSTPYFVPNEPMLAALCASARRGVPTTLLLPARNDSLLVAAASRSTYAALLAAGVAIHEYLGGLLHSKTLTIDGEVALIGSANMDRRSFELNYENNILVYDAAFTARLRQRQASYLEGSRPVSLAEVEARPMPRQLLDNAVAMLGPVL
jgi:cardiolipin synthase A/B